MPVSFTKPYTVHPAPGGAYVKGEWVPGAASAPRTVQLNVQPASDGDYQRVVNGAGGRGAGGALTALANAELQKGDAVLIDGERWNVVGRQPRAAFGASAETSHWKYLLALDAVAG